jgi:RNA polymerase sigma factor (sigma-70 family)
VITGSLQIQCSKRLETLFNDHHIWLVREAKKVSKSKEEAEDLVQELYEYLHTKCNIKLFWGNSYNLFYCNKFLHSRYMNKTKKLNRRILVENVVDTQEDIEYDWEKDLQIQKAHESVMQELKALQQTKHWPQARIFEMYWCSDDTLDEVSNKIGISKSTTFLAVKKIRKHLEEVINNPFDV